MGKMVSREDKEIDDHLVEDLTRVVNAQSYFHCKEETLK